MKSEDIVALGALASATGILAYVWADEERRRQRLKKIASSPPSLTTDCAPRPFMLQYTLAQRTMMASMRVGSLHANGIPIVAEEAKASNIRRVELNFVQPEVTLSEVIDCKLAPALGVTSTQLLVYVVCSGIVDGKIVVSAEQLLGNTFMGIIWSRLVRDSDFTVLLYVDLARTDTLEEQLDYLKLDVNHANPETGRTPFSDACALGLVDAAKILHARGAKTSVPLASGLLPLARAVINGHANSVEYLASLGENMNARDVSGRAALHYAALHNQRAVIETLLRLGADPALQDGDGNTFVFLAARMGLTRLVEEFASPASMRVANARGEMPLWAAAAHGHVALVSLLLKGAPECLSLADADGNTPLDIATVRGQVGVVKLLLPHAIPAHIGRRNNKGESTLHLACAHGEEEIMKLLLDAGWDINAKATDGATPILRACRYSHALIVDYLVSAGLVKNLPEQLDADGNNAFLLACRGKDFNILRTLAMNLVDFEATNKAGQNALMVACVADSAPIAAFLVANKICEPNPDASACPERLTPFALACKHGSNSVVTFFLETQEFLHMHKQFLTGRDEKGNLPIHHCMHAMDMGSALLLILSGSPIGKEAVNNEGVTPIQIATNTKRKDLTEVVLIALVARRLKWDLRKTFEKIGSFTPEENTQLGNAIELELTDMNLESSPYFSHVGDEVRRVLDIPSILTIVPDELVASSIAGLGKMRSGQLRGQLLIKYKDDGAQIGIDAGGLFRDWFHHLAEELFSEQKGLMVVEDVGGVPYLSLSPYIDVFSLNKDHETVNADDAFRTLGILVGLSITNNLPLGIRLAPHVIKQILGLPPTFADLKFVRSREYDFLSVVLNTDLPTQERQDALEALDLTFEITSREVEVAATMGAPSRKLQHQMSVLREDNPNEQVTLETVAAYSKLLVEKRLILDVKHHLAAFLDGLHDCLPLETLTTLQGMRVEDVQVLIAGDSKIDPKDWKAHSTVVPEEQGSSEIVGWFWQYVSSLSDEKRSKLLFWITGWKCLPIKGFAALPHKTVLNLTAVSEDHCPAAHTCSCQVDIPRFTTYDQLVTKFTYAIDHHEFGLV